MDAKRIQTSTIGNDEPTWTGSGQVDSGDYEILLQISGSQPLAKADCVLHLSNTRWAEREAHKPALPQMIRHSKLAEDREYRIYEVCALLADALLHLPTR
jgi:hypothetical protein